MVLLTVGAQLVETVLVRGVLYTAEAGARILYWAGSATLGYLWPTPPPKPTELERMQESIQRLEAQILVLENRNNIGSVHEDARNQEKQESMLGEEREEPQQMPRD